MFILTKHRYCPWIRGSALVYKMDVIDRYFLVLLKRRKRQFEMRRTLQFTSWRSV